MQECRRPSPQNAGMTVLSLWDGILTHLLYVSRHNKRISNVLQINNKKRFMFEVMNIPSTVILSHTA
jgi:hypothetical protein